MSSLPKTPTGANFTFNSSTSSPDNDLTPSASRVLPPLLEEPDSPTRGSRRFADAQSQALESLKTLELGAQKTSATASEIQHDHVRPKPNVPLRAMSTSTLFDNLPSSPAVASSGTNNPLSVPFHSVPQVKPITPGSGGTSFISQGGSGYIDIKDMSPYIRKDMNIKTQRTRIFFLDFIKMALKACAIDPNADGTALLNDVLKVTTALYNSADKFKDAKESLKEYCTVPGRTSDERLGYPSLQSCINKTFKALKNEKFANLKEVSDFELYLHRADPKEYHQSYQRGTTVRKPDFDLVSEQILMSHKKKNNYDKIRLQWPDGFSKLEIKLLGKNGFPTPPDQYTEESANGRKDYHVLHDNELRKSQLCASQRFEVDGDNSEALRSPNEYINKPITRLQGDEPSSSVSGLSSSQSSGQSSNHSIPESSTGSNLSTGSKRKAEDDPDSSSNQKKTKHNSSSSEKLKPNEQITMYGCEMLCRGIYSLHSINLLIMDDLVWLWYFDRQNIIQTTGLNFVQDFPYFIGLLVAFQRYSLEDWGVAPSLVPPSMFLDKDALKESVDIDFGNNIKANITHPTKLSLRGPVLKGRATSILDAKSNSVVPATIFSPKPRMLKDEELVLKASWPETSRMNEADIINRALERLAKGSDKDMIKHLPGLFASVDVRHSDTDVIMRAPGPAAASGSPVPRVLRMLLFRRLTPLEEVSNEKDFEKAWLDCFKCHYALWKTGIEHGDISVWNLMWDEKEKCGILNDFDLAVVKSDIDGTPLARGGERTGTLPFMARELLDLDYMSDKPIRLYRHELESFVWVFVWVCIKGVYDLRLWCGENSVPHKADFLQKYQRLAPAFSGAWDKGWALLELLKKMDAVQDLQRAVDKIRRRQASQVQFDDEELYRTVMKIMTDEEYTILDLPDFKDKLNRN